MTEPAESPQGELPPPEPTAPELPQTGGAYVRTPDGTLEPEPAAPATPKAARSDRDRRRSPPPVKEP